MPDFVTSHNPVHDHNHTWSDGYRKGHSRTFEVSGRASRRYYGFACDAFAPSSPIGYTNPPLDGYNPRALRFDGREAKVANREIGEYQILEESSS